MTSFITVALILGGGVFLFWMGVIFERGVSKVDRDFAEWCRQRRIEAATREKNVLPFKAPAKEA